MSDKSTIDFLIACGKQWFDIRGSIFYHLVQKLGTNNLFCSRDHLAQSAKSPNDLIRSLEAMDIASTPRTQSFAQELFNRTPREQSKKTGVSSSASEAAKKRRQEDAAAARLLEMNDSYGLLIDEDDRKEAKKKSKKSSSSKDKDKDKDGSEKKREKKIRKKDDSKDAWESDEEEKEYKRRKMEERERDARPPKTEGKPKLLAGDYF